MIENITDLQKRRAENIIWNCAEDYSFSPDFKAYDSSGDVDIYWNIIYGCARRHYEYDKLEKLLSSRLPGARNRSRSSRAKIPSCDARAAAHRYGITATDGSAPGAVISAGSGNSNRKQQQETVTGGQTYVRTDTGSRRELLHPKSRKDRPCQNKRHGRVPY